MTAVDARRWRRCGIGLVDRRDRLAALRARRVGRRARRLRARHARAWPAARRRICACPPLAVGLFAGLVWTIAPGRADRIVQRRSADGAASARRAAARDRRRALGAVDRGASGCWRRTCCSGSPARSSARGCPRRSSTCGRRDLAAYLMPPGVLAVAFALNFRQVLPPAAGDVLLVHGGGRHGRVRAVRAGDRAALAGAERAREAAGRAGD